MRRALSISLILLLWLPALAALLPGDAEARLPFCCRRQGAHHCAMDTPASATQSDSSGLVVTAPSRCSQFPGVLPATVGPVFIAATAHAAWTAQVSGIYSRVAQRDAARTGCLRTQLDRGPPSSVLA